MAESVSTVDTTTLRGLSGPGMGLTRLSAFAPTANPEPVQPHGVHFGGGALPEFYLPYPARTSPHLDRAREFAARWHRDIGLAQCGVWSADWTDRQDLALWAALGVPDASAEVVELVAGFGVWAFHWDDFFGDRFKRTRNPLAAKSYVDRLVTFMPADLADMPAPEDPVQAGLADLWTRMSPGMSPAARAAFPAQLSPYLYAGLWEIQNELQGRLPDAVDYVEMRRLTGAGELAYALAVLGLGGELPQEVLRHRTMQELNEVFVDIPLLRNDIISYDKEMREGEPHNLVLISQQFFGCDRAQATGIVNDLLTARIKQFQRLLKEDVPRMIRELRLDAAQRATLHRALRALRQWIAGDAAWAPGCPRYH